MANLELKLVETLSADAYNMDKEVRMLADALTKKVPGYKTAHKDAASRWVYRPQDTYALGWISYGDVFDTSSTGVVKKRYAVFAPCIENRKYGYGDKTYMASALHLDKALSNACKYLRPLNTRQVLEQVQRKFCKAINETKNAASQSADSVTVKVDTNIFKCAGVSEVPLNRELANILRSDYEFVDKELEAQLVKAFGAYAEHKEMQLIHDASHAFVEVVQSQGANLYRGFKSVPQSWSLYKHDNSHENKITYTQEQLPESLLGAISVLSMVEVGQYVSGVGYRAGENMFYIKGE